METLLSEYRFDYSKSKPNRFATKMPEGTIAVVLELDVAAAIRSSGKTGGSIAGVSAAATRGRVSTICSIISMCRGHRSFGGAVPSEATSVKSSSNVGTSHSEGTSILRR